MINRIISEIRVAMSNKLYLSALALALTLPDTCGKAEYPCEKRNGNRYKNWLCQYVIKDNCNSLYSYDMPYLNEEIIYSLRNSFLHQSTPSIDKKKINEARCKVDKFILVLTDEIGANGDMSMVAYGKDVKVTYSELKIYVSHLCYILCDAAEKYYKNNKDKFKFIKYAIEENESGENS